MARIASSVPCGKPSCLRNSGSFSFSASSCEKVWKGSVARLRVYDQPATTGKKVFAYLSPGSNSNYVGYSDDPNMIKALFLARDNGNGIQGYTNSKCRIEWIDY